MPKLFGRKAQLPAVASCGWAPHYGTEHRPGAVALVHLERPCGCAQEPVGTCSSCIGVLMDNLSERRVETRCGSCGEANGNSIGKIVDLD